MPEEFKAYLLKNKYRLMLAAILLAAFAVRINTFFATLQYDEIWTIRYFSDASVWKILTDLATPNNHPLNSLFVKLWRSCFELVPLIRLHSLVFGMLSVLLTGALALGLFRSRAAALFSMTFIAFDAAAVCYSDQARGYSAQLFFLLLFACGLMWSGRLRKFLPWRNFLPEAAMILGAVGAVLAAPSAPIFLMAIVIAARCYRRKITEPPVLIALGIAAALTAAYLGLNQAALQTAQSKFGVRFTDLRQWFGFVLMLVIDFFPLVTAPFLLVMAVTDRKRAMLLFFCALLIAGSAAFTSAGPSRVYLPICVLGALGCGRGAHGLLTVALCRNNRKLARIIVVTTAFLAGYGYSVMSSTLHLTDYCGWFEAGRAMSPEYFVVYPATAGLPLLANNDANSVIDDQLKRFYATGFAERKLLCFGVEPGQINGMNASGGEEQQKIGARGTPTTLNDFPAVVYRLAPAEKPLPGEPFVAAVPPMEDAAYARAMQALYALTPKNMLVFNPHFHVGGFIYGEAPDAAERWEAVRQTGIRVYTFIPDKTSRQP